MLDVIIPIVKYNNLEKTLASIAFQDYKESVNVIIVDSSNDTKVIKMIDLFKDRLNIKYVKDVVKDLALLDNKGIDTSTSKYITFIECGYVCKDILALSNLFKEDNDYDLIIGNIMFGDRNVKDLLYGNAYKREFIINNNIKLNRLDFLGMYFNKLCLSLSKNTSYCNESICFIDSGYSFSENEFTRKDNTVWLIKEYVKNNVDRKIIGALVFNNIVNIYYRYLDSRMTDKFVILSYAKDLYKYYEYTDSIDNEQKFRIFNSINYRKVPSMSLYEFIELLKK